jgi:2-desacetyl-2-hydroxyethyl bacteriochlorophyllide A dehydrogenase
VVVPETMPAAVYRAPGELVVERVPVPEPGDGEVLVEVSHCGVCGSDLHMVLEGWGTPGRVGGHEWSGRVVALGNDTDGWTVGDAVVGGAPTGCGECRYCRAGKVSLCERRPPPTGDDHNGAFATYVLARSQELLAIDEGHVPLRTAALTEPLAVSLHGVTQADAAAGSRALVTGAGPIGLLAVAALRARGVDDVTVSEPSPVRRRRALAVGATDAITPDRLDVPLMPSDLVADPYDVVLECSGHREAMEAGLAQLRPAGRLVLVGAGIHRPRFDNNRILLNELVVTGSYTYDDHGFVDALELLASGRLPTDLLVEPDDVPLDALLDAMRRLAAGEVAAKVLIAPN